MRSPIARMRRALSFALVPLSVVPIVLVLPTIAASERSVERAHERQPLPAPSVQFAASERSRFRPLPAFRGAVPVLGYHGINSKHDRYSVSRRSFAAQMALLDRLGFQTISIEQYARFYRGQPVKLPPHPILVTFDDGRLDSYRGADEVLRQHGFRATIFVITQDVERKNPSYLTWKELHGMAASGRWDVQPHAHDGHRLISSRPTGHTGSFYTVRRYNSGKGLESVQTYKRRVTGDLSTLVATLKHQGFRPWAFAVPFGDDGHDAGDDPVAAPFLHELLGRLFAVSFVQNVRNRPTFTRPGARAERYEVHTATTVAHLYDWLRTGDRHARGGPR